jgi:hypothetical protein
MTVHHRRSAVRRGLSPSGSDEQSRIGGLRRIPKRLRNSSPRRVRAWKARAAWRAYAYTELRAHANRTFEKLLSPEAAMAKYMRDFPFWSLAERQLQAANEAGAARAATAAAAARKESTRRKILRDEARKKAWRLQRHNAKVSIPVDHYIREISASADSKKRLAKAFRLEVRGPRRVRRAPRRARRVRRVRAPTRAGPADSPAPSKPRDDAPTARALSLGAAQGALPHAGFLRAAIKAAEVRRYPPPGRVAPRDSLREEGRS